MKEKLWEILVPTEIGVRGTSSFDTVAPAYHRRWDAKVREIVGNGMTIMHPTFRGDWVTDSGEIVSETMIPVRLIASYAQIKEVAEMTARHYRQDTVMYYLLSDYVVMHKRPTKAQIDRLLTPPVYDVRDPLSEDVRSDKIHDAMKPQRMTPPGYLDDDHHNPMQNR